MHQLQTQRASVVTKQEPQQEHQLQQQPQTPTAAPGGKGEGGHSRPQRERRKAERGVVSLASYIFERARDSRTTEEEAAKALPSSFVLVRKSANGGNTPAAVVQPSLAAHVPSQGDDMVGEVSVAPAAARKRKAISREGQGGAGKQQQQQQQQQQQHKKRVQQRSAPHRTDRRSNSSGNGPRQENPTPHLDGTAHEHQVGCSSCLSLGSQFFLKYEKNSRGRTVVKDRLKTHLRESHPELLRAAPLPSTFTDMKVWWYENMVERAGREGSAQQWEAAIRQDFLRPWPGEGPPEQQQQQQQRQQRQQHSQKRQRVVSGSSGGTAMGYDYGVRESRTAFGIEGVLRGKTGTKRMRVPQAAAEALTAPLPVPYPSAFSTGKGRAGGSQCSAGRGGAAGMARQTSQTCYDQTWGGGYIDHNGHSSSGGGGGGGGGEVGRRSQRAKRINTVVGGYERSLARYTQERARDARTSEDVLNAAAAEAAMRAARASGAGASSASVSASATSSASRKGMTNSEWWDRQVAEEMRMLEEQKEERRRQQEQQQKLAVKQQGMSRQQLYQGEQWAEELSDDEQMNYPPPRLPQPPQLQRAGVARDVYQPPSPASSFAIGQQRQHPLTLPVPPVYEFWRQQQQQLSMLRLKQQQQQQQQLYEQQWERHFRLVAAEQQQQQLVIQQPQHPQHLVIPQQEQKYVAPSLTTPGFSEDLSCSEDLSAFSQDEDEDSDGSRGNKDGAGVRNPSPSATRPVPPPHNDIARMGSVVAAAAPATLGQPGSGVGIQCRQLGLGGVRKALQTDLSPAGPSPKPKPKQKQKLSSTGHKGTPLSAARNRMNELCSGEGCIQWPVSSGRCSKHGGGGGEGDVGGGGGRRAAGAAAAAAAAEGGGGEDGGGGSPGEKKRKKRCSVANCESEAKVQGVCVRHGAVKKRCGIKGCSKQMIKGGLCVGHGATEVKRCVMQGCNKWAITSGLCGSCGNVAMHCSVDGCRKSVKEGDSCEEHKNRPSSPSASHPFSSLVAAATMLQPASPVL